MSSGDKEETSTNFGIVPDHTFLLESIHRRKKNEKEFLERYSSKNFPNFLHIVNKADSYPFIVGYYGTNISVKGTISIEAMIHNHDDRIVCAFIKDWRHSDEDPIKRPFYFTFRENYIAQNFCSLWNAILNDYQNRKAAGLPIVPIAMDKAVVVGSTPHTASSFNSKDEVLVGNAGKLGRLKLSDDDDDVGGDDEEGSDEEGSIKSAPYDHDFMDDFHQETQPNFEPSFI